MAKKPKSNIISINARPPKSPKAKLLGEAHMRRLARTDLQKIQDSVIKAIEARVPKDVLRYLMSVTDWDNFRKINGIN